MKVKIQKKEELKEYSLITSWEDVTLEKWLKLVDIDKDSASQEALKTIRTLSDIPNKLIKELGITDVAKIMQHFSRLQEKADMTHRNIITINEIEYGFHPKLDDITLGEYADIEQLIKVGLEEHLADLMAILYRPITEKKNKKYTIEAYDGELTMRAEEMKKMSAQQVQNALVFFWTFVMDLLRTFPSFLMEQAKEMKQKLQMETLQKNGVGSV
tara:strand:+ start:10292 stop:10933 length:642 start_codon:yes stop_codon:yes gene_type:complete